MIKNARLCEQHDFAELSESATGTVCPVCIRNQRITRLEHQLRDMEQMRDEAGRRYVKQVQECADKDRRIAELEKELVRVTGLMNAWKLETAHRNEDLQLTEDKVAHLRECLKRLEWCVPDVLGRKQCPDCYWNQPGEGVGNEMVRGHASDCWLAKVLEGE